jgi:hypothetical protein
MSGHASILNVGDFLKNGFFSQVAHSLVRERDPETYKCTEKSSIVMYICNPSTQEAETGGL